MSDLRPVTWNMKTVLFPGNLTLLADGGFGNIATWGNQNYF